MERATASTSAASVVIRTACALGEGPTWDDRASRLLWLDIDQCTLHELTSDEHVRTTVGCRTTAVVAAADGGLVSVAGTTVARLNSDGSTGELVAILPSKGDGMANDARCDPFGRLWVGTVDRSGGRRGGLYIVSSDGSVRLAKDGCELSNGLDWSPDGGTCYFADTFAHAVERLHLDDNGLPVSSSILFESDLMPDGLTVDSDGGVWVAFWDGGVVQRYTADGTLDHVVTVPRGGFVTSCAFGGDDLRTLYITTAAGGLSADELSSSPDAGALFAADVGIGGRGYTMFS